MPNRLLQYFNYSHLPDNLRPVSRACGRLAAIMDRRLPDGPEKTAGLRKLLEAKDCFVRANLEPGRVANLEPVVENPEETFREFVETTRPANEPDPSIEAPTFAVGFRTT